MDGEDQNQSERRPVLLFAFANDERPGRRLAGLCREIEDIRRSLAQAERSGTCEVVVRESATPHELMEVLEDPRYRSRLTTIHFAGHASGSRLLLEGDDEPIVARIEGLASLLTRLESLALVFLNGCRTHAQGEQLVRAGIPAVIATEHAVDDEQAQRFAADFYRSVAGGASIAAAFGWAEAQARCFVPRPGVVRDLGLPESDEPPPFAWRLLLADPHEDAKDWSLSTAADDPLFGLPAARGGTLPQEPFMGLRRFTARESAVLFGRGRAIRNLYDDVVDPAIPPLIVVYGASGVGKSSLLEAGLLPRVAATTDVHDLRLERGQDPEVLLRRALGYAAGRGDVATAWKARERELGRAVVICIDQLEALMLEDDGAKALVRFVQALVPLAQAEHPRGKLLLGLRKEWFAELRNELRRHALEWHDHFVEPLGRDDIEEVVLGPTRTASLRARYGITCEEGLARRISDDLCGDRRSVIAPMLQILLTRMWERTKPQLTSRDGRVRRRFTLAVYDELRRDGLALSDFVDRQLDALRTTHADALASGLVLELLVRHTTPRGTAAASSHAELRDAYAPQWPMVERLVERCTSLYLLQDVVDAKGVSVGIRLAHDTLAPIVRDRALRSKAPAQAAARLMEARIGMSDAAGRSALLDEHDLAQVEAAQPGMRRWTEEEQRLVEASRRRRVRATWLRRGRWAVVIASLAVAAVALVIRDAKDEPVVDKLSTSVARPSNPGPRVETEAEIDASAAPSATELVPEALLGDAGREALALARSRPGALAREGECVLRRVEVASGATAQIETVSISPDGERLAAGLGKRHKAFVIDPRRAALEEEIGTKEQVNVLQWSPDGRHLAIGEDGGHVELLRVDGTAPREDGSCAGHAASISALAFSADGKTLLSADREGEVLVRDAPSCARLRGITLAGAVHAMHEARAKGRSTWYLAGKGGLAQWNGTAAHASLLTSPGVSLKSVTSSTRAGRLIAAGQRLQMWDPSGEHLVDQGLAHVADWVFVDEHGEAVITVSSSGIRLWPWPSGDEQLVPLDTWTHDAITDVAAYPDLRDLLVVTADGSVRWLQRQVHELVELSPFDVGASRGGAIALDPEHGIFAVGDHAGQVSLVTLPTNREMARECAKSVVLQAIRPPV